MIAPVSSAREPVLAPPPFGRARAGSLGVRWSALHDAADAIAAIAGMPGEARSVSRPGLPAQAGDADRRALVEQGIDDLSALLMPGLSALLAALARGAQPRAAARTLLAEFDAARDGLLHLAMAMPARACPFA